MADYLTTTAELTSIADAIRAKSGKSWSLVYPSGFIDAVNDIEVTLMCTTISDSVATKISGTDDDYVISFTYIEITPMYPTISDGVATKISGTDDDYVISST